MPNPKRVMAYSVHREGTRPLLIINVYMPAGPGAAAVEREALIHDTVEWAVGTGEDFLALGDWNCEDDAVPMGELIAAGGVMQADQAWLHDRRPTSRVREGQQAHVIDYGIYHGQVAIRARHQGDGPSDTHDAISYMVALEGRPRMLQWPRPRALRDVPPRDKYNRYWHCWPRLRPRFERALNRGDTEAA